MVVDVPRVWLKKNRQAESLNSRKLFSHSNIGNTTSTSETIAVRGGQENNMKVAPSTPTCFENISVVLNEVPAKGLHIYNNTCLLYTSVLLVCV